MPLIKDAVGRVHRHGGRGEHFTICIDACGAVVGRVSILLPFYERSVIMAVSSMEQVPKSPRRHGYARRPRENIEALGRMMRRDGMQPKALWSSFRCHSRDVGICSSGGRKWALGATRAHQKRRSSAVDLILMGRNVRAPFSNLDLETSTGSLGNKAAMTARATIPPGILFVTGGARGLGHAIALAFAREGCSGVAIVDILPDDVLKSAEAAVVELGAQV